jgi:predicted dienelactone hydrolase
MLLLLACAAPDAAPDTAIPFHAPDAPGPWHTGVTTLTFTDARNKALTVEVWYPTDSTADPDPYPEIPFTGTAIRDADPAAGPFPVVAFSHGNAGIRYQSIFLTEYLATHGFVVVAPDHPRNTLLDFDADALVEVALERPGDVVSAVDEVFALSATDDPIFAGLVQTDRYGMSGHSFGGWTTLAVAGGVTDWPAFRDFCAQNAGYDLCGIDVPDDAVIADAPDPRAVAALPMAPAGWYSFGATGLSTLAPALLMGGEHDEDETLDHEILPLYDRMPSPKALATIAGAGHYAFTDICLLGDVQPDCEEEAGGYIAIDRAHDLIRTLATAFFEVRLAGDDRYADWLGPIGDEITWAED